MEISDYIKILFGAAVGFAGSWVQSWLRRDEERLKLHREKLENLYLLVNEWNKATAEIYWRVVQVLPSSEAWDEIGKIIDEKNTDDKIKPLILFYANGLMHQYNEYRRCWNALRDAIYSEERDGEEIKKQYKSFQKSSSAFEDAIVNEGKKYILQSVVDRFKNMVSWK